MWLLMSIVNARPFYKRMRQDVIKLLWVEYMPQLTSMGGLRKNYIYQNSPLREVWEEINFIWQKWLIVLYVYTSLWYVYYELPKEKKKEVVLAYKGCGHYCVAIQICHWLCTYGTTKEKQETCFAHNDFDHHNNNIISSLKEMLTIGMVSCNMS